MIQYGNCLAGTIMIVTITLISIDNLDADSEYNLGITVILIVSVGDLMGVIYNLLKNPPLQYQFFFILKYYNLFSGVFSSV